MVVPESPALPVPGTPRRPLGAVALTALLTVLVLLGGLVAFAPRLFGATQLVVDGHSMEPALSRGDLVVVEDVDPDELRVGDIIAFRPRRFGDDIRTHRIIEITREDGAVVRIRTRGDGLAEADDPITPAHLVGRVSYSVPLVGSLLQSPLLIATITLLGVGLLGVTITAFFVPSLRLRRH